MSKNQKKTWSTIEDVAESAGVSTATVSRVINSNAPVAEETAQRIWEAIEKLQYVPRAAARTLAGRKTNTIGLILPRIGGAFFAPMLKGMEEAAWENRFEILIYTSREPLISGLRNFHRAVGEHNTDGMVLFTNTLDEAELRNFYEKKFPLVLLHQTPPKDMNIPCITFENKGGAQKLIDHLIEIHGYTRIGFLAGPKGHEDSWWRERGYRESLQAHGISVDPELISVGGFDAEQAAAAVEKWIVEGVEIEAIFAGDDEAASGVIGILHKLGKKIPSEIAVVGFDDVHVSRHLTPPLTTIRAPIEEAGFQGVTRLIQLINGDEPEGLVLLPTELIVRESCGCQAG